MLAALFFVVIFGGELVARRVQPEPMTVAQAPQFFAPVEGKGGGGGAEIPESQWEMPAEEVAVEGETTLAEDDGTATKEMAEKAYEPPMAAAQAPNLAVTPVGVPIGTPTPMGTPIPSEAPEPEERSLFAAPLDQDVTLGAQAEPTALPDEDAGAPPAWSVLRVVQILLALLAVGCGLGAIYLRRSARG